MKATAKVKPSLAPRKPDYIEGPEAFQRFDNMMTALISVPKAVVDEREKAYRAQVDANLNRRGPKRKTPK